MPGWRSGTRCFGRYDDAARALALAEPIPEDPMTGGLGISIVIFQALPAKLRVYFAPPAGDAEADELAHRFLAKWRGRATADPRIRRIRMGRPRGPGGQRRAIATRPSTAAPRDGRVGPALPVPAGPAVVQRASRAIRVTMRWCASAKPASCGSAPKCSRSRLPRRRRRRHEADTAQSHGRVAAGRRDHGCGAGRQHPASGGRDRTGACDRAVRDHGRRDQPAQGQGRHHAQGRGLLRRGAARTA